MGHDARWDNVSPVVCGAGARLTQAYYRQPIDRAYLLIVTSVYTERNEAMELTPVTQKFVLHWGEMGTRWGVNRTVAQIHALLYLADEPLHAEEIAETLGVARSNVSTSLRELQNWRLIHLQHVMGDRRDHFQAAQDIWEICRVIVDERRRRELDPTLTVLRQCVLELTDSKDTSPAGKRITSALEFLEQLTHWMDEMKRVPPDTAMKLLRLGAKIQKLLT